MKEAEEGCHSKRSQPGIKYKHNRAFAASKHVWDDSVRWGDQILP
jgi:hypothetical protein